MGRVENIEEQGAVQVPLPKRPVGPFLIYYKKQIELMKAKGIVDKISAAVKNEIREKWMNLDEDSKLEYKKEARENSEKYANLSHNIPRKSHKVSLYTRCAPNRVRLIALNLNERQRFVIQEMGFGSMLDLRSIQLDRDFCKWLVDHFDHNSCALDICGRRLPISTKDIEFILGIKSSGVDVSIVASAEEINHICQQHGLNMVGDIPINLLEGKLKEMKTSGKEFVGCFLLFVLGTLLCPTPKPYIKRSFISILLNIDEFKNLNWAKLVLDFLIRGVRKYKEKNHVGVNGCLLFLMLFYFEHVNVETNLEHVSKRLQPRVCYWGKKEVNQRMLKLQSIGSFDSPKLVVTQMDGGHETESIPLEKKDINESHAMPSQHEDKRNMGFDEAICRIEQSITSLRDEMLVMQKTVTNIANNMDTFKNDILLELKKTTRQHSGCSNDLNFNDIVDVKKEMKSASPYIIQDTMDQDDTVCAKKESKIESTSLVQDKMDQDDTVHIKKVSKMVSLEEDCNVHIAGLTQSNQKPSSKTPLSHNVDVDMLQLTFPHNVQLKASCVTPSSKPKVTRSQKRSPIVTSQAEVPKVKKRKEIKDSLQESRLGDDEDMNEFEPFTEMEKIICNYIFNKNFEKSEVLVSMKYEYGDRAAFNTLLPNQWISSQIINLFVCKMRMEENRYKDMFVWYLPTHFAQKMLEEDGNPTLEWFKRTYRDDDKYMSNLMKCEQIFIPMNDDNSHWYLCVIDFVKRITYILDSLQSATSEVIRTKNVKTVVTGLDKLLSYLEKDKYIDSITRFKLKSPVSNPQQNNGYDCGMYVIKHMFTNTSWRHLPLLESWSERLRYKLAASLVLSKDNDQRSRIVEIARNIPLQEYFRSLKD